jgi:hypothetical protein
MSNHVATRIDNGDRTHSGFSGAEAPGRSCGLSLVRGSIARAHSSLDPRKAVAALPVPLFESANPDVSGLPGDALEQVGDIAFQRAD